MERFHYYFFIGLTLFAFGASSSNKIQRNDNVFNSGQLAEGLIKFLKPYQLHIQEWFWIISGSPYNSPFYLNQSHTTDIGPMAEYITCEICLPLFPTVKWLLGEGVQTDDIIGIITIACQALNLAPRSDVCEPTIRSYATPIMHIVQNKPEITHNDFCGIINPGCAEIRDDFKNWEIDIQPKNGGRSTHEMKGVHKQTPLAKILQFTDVHLDLSYSEGSNSDCGLPTCCRERDGQPQSPAKAAGKWGHYSCAMAPDGLKAMFKHAAEVHSDTKLVFLTGDFIHSNIWEYGIEENSRHHEAVTSWLQEAFQSTSPEIYPVVGNHEPDVVNMYPPEEVWNEFPLRWMYSSIANAFGDFLPSDQMELFLKYGYYTVTFKLDPKLRIIVLNTNLCYVNNLWLPYDPKDTSGQLQWLADRLHEAEMEGQSVLLLGHVPPGSDCWPVWSRQFERIVQRYHEIIRGQWYGHKHEQDYKIGFQGENPISTAFIAGSGIPSRMNPGYNVYYADGESWEILNHQTYILNLSSSNANPEEEPIFTKILDTKEDWGLQSLAPKEVHGFIYRMVCDDDLFLEYEKIKKKGADSPRFNPCLRNDYRCKANVLGNLFVANSGDHQHKDRLEDYILRVDCNAQDTTDDVASSTGSTGGSTTQASRASNIFPKNELLPMLSFSTLLKMFVFYLH